MFWRQNCCSHPSASPGKTAIKRVSRAARNFAKSPTNVKPGGQSPLPRARRKTRKMPAHPSARSPLNASSRSKRSFGHVRRKISVRSLLPASAAALKHLPRIARSRSRRARRAKVINISTRVLRVSAFGGVHAPVNFICSNERWYFSCDFLFRFFRVILLLDLECRINNISSASRFACSKSEQYQKRMQFQLFGGVELYLVSHSRSVLHALYFHLQFRPILLIATTQWICTN